MLYVKENRTDREILLVDEIVAIQYHRNIIISMNTMNTIGETGDSIPWYRTRWFWAVVIGVLVISSLLLFSQLYLSQTSLLNKLEALLLIPGASTVVFLTQTIFGRVELMDSISLILYYLIAILLLYLGFRRPRVEILYVSVFVVNLLLSSLLIYYLLSNI